MAVSANTQNYDFNLIDFDSVTWHEDEYENWHAVDAVLKSFFNTSGFTGVWMVSTTYEVGDLAVDEVTDEVFEVLVGHTSESSGLFSADRTANPTFWEVWLLSHAGSTTNPHSVTKAQVGLGSVEDTEQQPLDATLTAFAALVGEADRLPFFTADDVFGLTIITAAGRALLNDGSVAVQRVTLDVRSTAEVTAEVNSSILQSQIFS